MTQRDTVGDAGVFFSATGKAGREGQQSNVKVVTAAQQHVPMGRPAGK